MSPAAEPLPRSSVGVLENESRLHRSLVDQDVDVIEGQVRERQRNRHLLPGVEGAMLGVRGALDDGEARRIHGQSAHVLGLLPGAFGAGLAS